MPRVRTLRRQLVIWLAAPLVALWVISGVVDYDIAKRFVNLAYDRALLETALDIGRSIKRVDNRIYIDLPEAALQMLETRESGRVHFLVTRTDGDYISGNPELPRPPGDEITDRVTYYDSVFRDRAIRLVVLRQPIRAGTGQGAVYIYVGERLMVRAESARQLLFRIMVPQALLILVAVFVVWYAVGRGLHPLDSLQRELATRSDRDLSPLPQEQVPDELRPLIRAMNELLDRLSRVLESRQRFVADAAHQLRTPVAGIKTQTELALRQSSSPDAQATLKQLHTATEQATRLVNQLLALARAEPGTHGLHAEPVDLVALARETTTEWVPRALGKNIDLGFDSPLPAARVAGDPFMLREMLTNLLDNAVRYTQAGGRVTTRVTQQENHYVLSVEDNGPGVSQADRELVFERFYRVLGTGVEGCGLGLAIVREIALAHGGQAALTGGSNGTGTMVSITLPRAA